MAIWKDKNGVLHDDMGGVAQTLPSWPHGMVLLPEEQVHALQLHVPTTAQAWAAHQGRAQAALARSDCTMLRVVEAVALGHTSFSAADVVTYATWRRALRAILEQEPPASVPETLPVEPAYPANI